MQSLGNDFVIIDQLKNPIKFSKNDIKKISNRNYGIGCDQVLVLEKSEKKEIAFKYKIYNKDGTESGQCGNGAKCIGKYYFDKYGKNRKEIKIETISRRMSLRILKNSLIEVDMGLPLFNFKEYKSINIQLDQLYHDMTAGKLDATGEWHKSIKAVKDKYPKGGE